MKNVHQWLDEYGQSHQHSTNKMIHWICVPSIFFSITGLLYSVKLPLRLSGTLQLNVAILILLLITIYYFALSIRLGIGMLLFGIACLLICYEIEKNISVPLWLICIIIFVLAWIGQFYGHKVEGKKPSFFKDIQFLLIGPMWIMSFIYKKLGVGY
jgi:uncharacterized membrane protein YGL010W